MIYAKEVQLAAQEAGIVTAWLYFYIRHRVTLGKKVGWKVHCTCNADYSIASPWGGIYPRLAIIATILQLLCGRNGGDGKKKERKLLSLFSPDSRESESDTLMSARLLLPTWVSFTLPGGNGHGLRVTQHRPPPNEIMIC